MSAAPTRSVPRKTEGPVEPPRFSGFPEAGLEFLADLKENNDREWFRERKHIYEETVRRPMELLAYEVAAACRKRGFALHAKDKNPVTRIYRDIRFSPNKTPFNTHAGAALKSNLGKTSHGEVYLHISPGESFLAAGFWMPDRQFLRAWREAMASAPEKFKRVLTALSKRQLQLSTEGSLSRMPRGFDQFADHALADYFKLSSFVVTHKLKPEAVHSASLVETAADFALSAKPLIDYGWNLDYSPAKDILAETR